MEMSPVPNLYHDVELWGFLTSESAAIVLFLAGFIVDQELPT